MAPAPEDDARAPRGGIVDRERDRAGRARRRVQEEAVAMARAAPDDRAVHELAREVNERAAALHERAAAVFEEAGRLRGGASTRASLDGARRDRVPA